MMRPSLIPSSAVKPTSPKCKQKDLRRRRLTSLPPPYLSSMVRYQARLYHMGIKVCRLWLQNRCIAKVRKTREVEKSRTQVKCGMGRPALRQTCQVGTLPFQPIYLLAALHGRRSSHAWGARLWQIKEPWEGKNCAELCIKHVGGGSSKSILMWKPQAMSVWRVRLATGDHRRCLFDRKIAVEGTVLF
jgi:hypothetical protein